MLTVHLGLQDTSLYSNQIYMLKLMLLFFHSVPRIPWAFAMAEACGLILCYMFLLILLLHKHR